MVTPGAGQRISGFQIKRHVQVLLYNNTFGTPSSTCLSTLSSLYVLSLIFYIILDARDQRLDF